MTDVVFEHQRLTAIYDALDPDRSDLEVDAALVDELGAHTVLDIGCGTGGVRSAAGQPRSWGDGGGSGCGMLGVARAKPGAEQVTWLHCTAAALPVMQLDLAVMTGNLEQDLAHHGGRGC